MTFTINQGSYDWLQDRVGYATASRFKDVMGRLKSGAPNQACKDYLADVVCERLTGQPVKTYANEAMRWGTEMEPEARQAYMIKTGRGVDEVSFLKHPTMMAGASPDGIVELEGLIEIKCPNSTTHQTTLLEGMNEDHLYQIQGQLWITGYDWCDFVSYDPRMPKGLDLYVQRVPRDDAFIGQLESGVREFLALVDERVEALRRRVA